MNLSEYQSAAKRTDIGFEGYKSACERFSFATTAVLWHGIIGMNSEIGELFKAANDFYREDDETTQVSLEEEVGDTFWYLSRAFEGIGSSIDVCGPRQTCVEANQYEDNEEFFEDFAVKLGKITDIAKKELIYGKVVSDYSEYEKCLKDIYYSLEDFCSFIGISINVVLEKNIAKLKARYPEQFTLELSENRDLENERKVLEGQ